MNFSFSLGSIVLECVIDFQEVDCFLPTSGHYTTKGAAFVESVTHKGQDITEIIDESVFEAILDQFNNEQGE